MNRKKGFTLIELLITIAILSVLSGIIMFSVTQYINRSRDAAIQGTLSSLIPAGEVFYDHNSGNGYNNLNVSGSDFCGSSIFANANNSVSLQLDNSCQYNGKPVICCKATANAWAACAYEFADKTKAFCVDSTGIKREICTSGCSGSITSCPPATTYCISPNNNRTF